MARTAYVSGGGEGRVYNNTGDLKKRLHDTVAELIQEKKSAMPIKFFWQNDESYTPKLTEFINKKDKKIDGLKAIIKLIEEYENKEIFAFHVLAGIEQIKKENTLLCKGANSKCETAINTISVYLKDLAKKENVRNEDGEKLGQMSGGIVLLGMPSLTK